ncbi:hypothetical protein Q7P36_011269 [Cladosporium allicinum]
MEGFTKVPIDVPDHSGHWDYSNAFGEGGRGRPTIMAVCDFCSVTYFKTEWRPGKKPRRKDRDLQGCILSLRAACTVCTLLFEQYKTLVQQSQAQDVGDPTLKHSASTVTGELTLEDKRFEYALDKFLSNRDLCCSNNPLFGSNGNIFARQDPFLPSSQIVNDVREFIARIMTGPTQAEDTLWNDQIANVFPSLTGNSIREYVSNSTHFVRYGADQEARIIMCNLDQVDAEVTSSSVQLSCGCSRLDSCAEGDLLCINGEDDDEVWSEDGSDNPIERRGFALEKRGGVRKFPYEFIRPLDNVEYSGGSPSFPYTSVGKDSARKWPPSDQIWSRIFAVPDPRDCLSTDMQIKSGQSNAIKPMIQAFGTIVSAQMNNIAEHAKKFVKLNTQKIRDQIEGVAAPWALLVKLATYKLDRDASAFAISLDGFTGAQCRVVAAVLLDHKRFEDVRCGAAEEWQMKRI